MAEYYPLLARAVAGMHNAPAEQRRAIYDRARQALLGQLRSMQPPVPPESIDRESTALDAAIARVEADLAAPPAEVPTQAEAPAAESPAPPPVPDAAAPPPVPLPEPPPVSAAPPVVVPPPVVPPPVVMPPRAVPARPAAEALSRIMAERAPVAPPVRVPKPQDAVAGQVLPLPSAPRLEMPSFADALAAADDRDPAQQAAEASADAALLDDEPAAQGGGGRDEPLRPPAPRPITRERFNGRALILATVGVLVVAGIAYAAWRLRDRPEALARSQAAMLAAQQAEQQHAAKVGTRAEGGSAPAPASTAPPAVASSTPPVTASAAPTAAPSPAASSAPPASSSPSTDGAAPVAVPAASPEPQGSPLQAAPNPASTTTPVVPVPSGTATAATDGAAAVPSGNPAIAVAQRAAFLVDAPDDPAKVKTFVGTVVWTTENASPAQDQPISRTVHAEIDVPEADLRLSVVFQKNLEAQFPASHTLELRFTLLPGNTLGPIKQINVPQMRKDDSPSGDPLIGLPVTITDDYFLVGLSRGEATQHNLDLIKSRNWFDVPLLLASGKIAKITFEKGATGQQAIDEVLQSWQ